MYSTTRVLLADEHPIMRIGLQTILGSEENIEVVGEATNGFEVQHKIQTQLVDVLLLNFHMPGPLPEETAAFIQKHSPRTKIIVLSNCDDLNLMKKAILCGIAGYITKEDIPDKLAFAIKTIKNGENWFSKKVLENLAQVHQPLINWKTELTTREKHLLNFIAKGCSNKQIANELHLAEQTVRNYISRLYLKLNIQSRGEAIIWARQRGIGYE